MIEKNVVIILFIIYRSSKIHINLNLFKLYPHNTHNHINDQYWKSLQPCSNWYYSLKRVGKQRPSFSNLENCDVNYGV